MREVYDELKTHFREHDEVEIAEGKGAQGLKMFAMFYKGDLTVKLAPESVLTCIENGQGLPHDPGTGKPMKDRLLIPSAQKDTWVEMCELSLEHVSS